MRFRVSLRNTNDTTGTEIPTLHIFVSIWNIGLDLTLFPFLVTVIDEAATTVPIEAP